MAKIGSVQVEITPHISDDALDAIAEKVAAAVERGVRKGMAAEPVISHANVTSAYPASAVAAQVERKQREAEQTH